MKALEPNSWYVFRVAAASDAGPSEWSHTASYCTATAPPGACLPPSAVAAGFGALQVGADTSDPRRCPHTYRAGRDPAATQQTLLGRSCHTLTSARSPCLYVAKNMMGLTSQVFLHHLKSSLYDERLRRRHGSHPRTITVLRCAATRWNAHSCAPAVGTRRRSGTRSTAAWMSRVWWDPVLHGLRPNRAREPCFCCVQAAKTLCNASGTALWHSIVARRVLACL